LVARKLAGPEKSSLADADIAFDESEYQRLRADLQAAHEDLQIAGVTERRHARSVG